MSYASDAEAMDEIYGVLNLAWQNNASGVVGYTPALRWPGTFEDSAPDVTKHWGRVSTQTVMQEKANLANEAGGNKFRTDGLLYVQLFAPITQTGAFAEMERLGRIARDAFRDVSAPGGAWFRNARVRELPNDAKFYRSNVVVEYEFDTRNDGVTAAMADIMSGVADNESPAIEELPSVPPII